MKKAFFSNNLDILYERLKENISKNSFFTMQMVFVKNFHMKDWILKKLAKEKKEAFIKFIDIKNLSKVLLDIFSKKEIEFPNYLELNLSIEKNLLKIIKDFPSLSFLKDESIEKFSSLIDQLTELFFLYALFEKNVKLTDWQKILFQKVFKKWAYPSKEFSKIKNLQPKIDVEMHFFSISYIAEIFFNFLQNTPLKIFHYILSPCKYFWEDNLSNREKKYILKKNLEKKQFLEISNYLEDSHPLLANLGTLKRKYLKILDRDDLDIIEDYEEIKGVGHLLQSIKKDLLDFQKPKKISYDKTIQIQEVFSKKREIEVLYDYLANILSKEDISMSDIKVVSTNIDEYVPYIHMVFGKRDSYFNYKMSHTKKINSGILDLFSLVDSRWIKEDVLKLFENSFFQKKHNLSKEDIIIIKKWIEKANISWGLDENHRKNILSGNTDLFINTWRYGIERILSGFIFKYSKNIDCSVAFPIDKIGFSDIDLFEKFIQIFEDLKKDILKIENKRCSVSQWEEIIKEIIEKNFFLEDLFSNYKDLLKNLKKADKYFKKDLFTFNTIFKFLKKAEIKNISFNSHLVDSIHFCSLKNLIPAKVICFLNLTEDFPKKDTFFSLNLLKEKYFPTKNDIDRNHFLDLFLLAKNFLYFSYVKINIEGEEILPSSLLNDFIYYLEEGYKIDRSFLIKSHSPISFDKRYFLKEKRDFYSFSKNDYLGAKKYYSKDQYIKYWDFEKPLLREKEIPKIVEIDKLISLCKNPFKFYFNHVLEIYLENMEDLDKKDFIFSFLERYKIKNLSLKMPVDIILKNYEKEGLFPLGGMKEIAKEEIKEEITSFFRNLKEKGIKNIFDIDLKLFMKKEEEKTFPAININMEGRDIKIIGKIKNITNKGYLSFKDKKFSEIVSIWPEILIFLKLQKKLKLEPFLFFAKNSKFIKIPSFDVDKYLIKYLKYYEICLSNISFMTKDWANIFLKKDESFLKKAFSKENFFEDIYFNKIFENEKPNAKKIFDKWSNLLKDTFKPLQLF